MDDDIPEGVLKLQLEVAETPKSKLNSIFPSSRRSSSSVRRGGVQNLGGNQAQLSAKTKNGDDKGILVDNDNNGSNGSKRSCTSIRRGGIQNLAVNEGQLSVEPINSSAVINNNEEISISVDHEEHNQIHVDEKKNEDDTSIRLEASAEELEEQAEKVLYNKKLFKSMDIDEGCNSINARRLVNKGGEVDIRYVNMPGIKTRFMRDLFHTLMDARWRWNCLLFTLSFLISWVFFAIIWYIIVEFRTINCIDNVSTFTQAFLFSLETQTSIGYGGRAVTAECPEGVILLGIQTIIGMFINCFMLGLMFGKLARPKNRGKTTMFSRNAVITVRDGYFCLIFRYADLCRRILLDSNMRMVIIRPRLTAEGEFIPLDMADLALTIDYEQVEYTMRLFPVFPITMIHIIDEESPLYNMSKSNLQNSQFEIIAILEGTVPTTGNTTQALTSYRPDEVLWGHRFKPVALSGSYDAARLNSIDLMTINDTYKETITPSCSAEDYLRDKSDSDDSDSSSSSSSSSSSPTPSRQSRHSKSKDAIDSEPVNNVDADVKDTVEVDENRIEETAQTEDD